MSEAERRPAGARANALKRISERLAANPWALPLARLGYASEGLLYVIVGGAAALASMKVGGRVRGTRGALDLIVAQPFGRLAVALMAVGLCGIILRRAIEQYVENPIAGMILREEVRPRHVVVVDMKDGALAFELSGKETL